MSKRQDITCNSKNDHFSNSLKLLLKIPIFLLIIFIFISHQKIPILKGFAGRGRDRVHGELDWAHAEQ